MSNIDGTIFDALVHQQIDNSRYSQQQVKELVGLLNEADKEILAKIAKATDGTFTKSRLEALLKETRATVDDTYQTIQSNLRDEMLSFAAHSDDIAGSILASQMPVHWNPVAMTSNQYAAILDKTPIRLGKDKALLFDEVFSSLAAGKEEKVRSALRLGMVQGESMPDLIKRIQGTKANGYSDGILEGSRRDLANIVHTTVQHTSNQAAHTSMMNNADVLNGWIYVGTLDSRMCSYCAQSYGQKFALGQGPIPPKHVGCRCFQAPDVKTWKELGFDSGEAPKGMKASASGPVKANMSYQEWLKQQQPSVQDDVLGKARAQIFRDGNLKLDKFYDASGKMYTLDDLQVKANSAVEKLATKATRTGFDASALEYLPNTQKGSNLGGLYRAPDGQQYYVKFYKDEKQAFSEIAATQVYKNMGLEVPELRMGALTDPNGKQSTGLISKWIDGLKRMQPEDMAAHPDLPAIYQASVATKNWDVVGTGFDNLMLTNDNRMICVDYGGTLNFRAQGGAKSFDSAINEVKSYLDPNLNAESAKVFSIAFNKNVFAEAEGAPELLNLNKSTLTKIFKTSGFDAAEAKELTGTMLDRIELLVDRYNADGRYTYDGFGKYLEDFKKWGGSAATDRELTDTGGWTSYSLKQRMESLVTKFEKYVDDNITKGGATKNLKTMLGTDHGWSNNSSNAGGAVMKQWSMDFFKGTETNLYQRYAYGDAPAQVQALSDKFLAKQGVDKSVMNELLKAEYEFQQYYLTRLNGYDSFQIERGMSEIEFQNDFKIVSGKAEYQNGGMYSATNNHEAWTGTDRRISFVARNEDIFKTWYQGTDYMHYGASESEYVTIGRKYRALELKKLGHDGWSQWVNIK